MGQRLQQAGVEFLEPIPVQGTKPPVAVGQGRLAERDNVCLAVGEDGICRHTRAQLAVGNHRQLAEALGVACQRVSVAVPLAEGGRLRIEFCGVTSNKL